MKKLNKDLLGLGYSNLLIGTGSMLTAKLGYGQSSFSTASKFMPIASIAMMGGYVQRTAKSLTKKKRM